MVVAIVSVVCGLLILLGIWEAWARLDTLRLEKFEKACREFYDHAQVLVTEHELPVSAISVLELVNQSVMDKRTARQMVMVLLAGKLVSFPRSQEVAKFRRDAPNSANLMSRACYFGFRASTYQSIFAGWFVRRFIIASPKVDADRAEAMAESMLFRNCPSHA